MGYRGQVLDNPVTGERFVFHATSDDTVGKLLEFDLVVQPKWARSRRARSPGSAGEL
jgi:hypothetical protein